MYTEMDRSEYFILGLWIFFRSLSLFYSVSHCQSFVGIKLTSTASKSMIISSIRSRDWISSSLIVAIVRSKRSFTVHRNVRLRDALAVSLFASVGHVILPKPEKRQFFILFMKFHHSAEQIIWRFEALWPIYIFARRSKLVNTSII